MSVEEKMDQIAGILNRNEIPFAHNEDNSSYRVLAGSTGVFVSAHPFGEGTVVHLEAPVIVDFDLKKQAGNAFNAVNELNNKSYFAKFTVRGEDGHGTICAEVDVLGDDLQGSELMNALGIAAGMADENDDRLKADIGGKTYAEVLNASEEKPLET